MRKRENSNMVPGGRDLRDAERGEKQARIKRWMDQTISTVLPHLDDISLDFSDHENQVAEAIRIIDGHFYSTLDRTTARARLEARVIDYNRRCQRNLHVPIAPVRFINDRPRHTEAAMKTQRELNKFHESVMAALDRPQICSLSTDDRLGVLLYFAVTWGGLAHPVLVNALHDALVAAPIVDGHESSRRVWVVLRFDSRSPNEPIGGDFPNTSRLWFVPDPCQLPLLAYLKAFASNPPRAGGTAESRIRGAMAKLCPPGLPAMSFRDFCRAGICVTERQPGMELPEYLVSFCTLRLQSVSPPPSHWRYYQDCADMRNWQ